MKQKLETPRPETISAVAQHIKEALSTSKGSVVVVHGAGSFGHQQASTYRVAQGPLTDPDVHRGFAITRASVTKLNNIVVESLVQAGVPAVGISPFGSGWSTSNRQVCCCAESVQGQWQARRMCLRCSAYLLHAVLRTLAHASSSWEAIVCEAHALQAASCATTVFSLQCTRLQSDAHHQCSSPPPALHVSVKTCKTAHAYSCQLMQCLVGRRRSLLTESVLWKRA